MFLYAVKANIGFSSATSNHFPITLKRGNNWLYWSDDRVKTTCAGGKQQFRVGGLSLHALQIWQTPNTSWPLGGWTLDLRWSHRAQILSGLSRLNPVPSGMHAHRRVHKHTLAFCSLHGTYWNWAQPEQSISVQHPSLSCQNSLILPYCWSATVLDKPGVE